MLAQKDEGLIKQKAFAGPVKFAWPLSSIETDLSSFNPLFLQQSKRSKETLLTCLSDLFYNIVTQKKKVGTIAPKKFIARLKKENELFDNFMQQDAHEFLNYLLNSVADLLQVVTLEILLTKKDNSTDHFLHFAKFTWIFCRFDLPTEFWQPYNVWRESNPPPYRPYKLSDCVGCVFSM